MKKKIKEVKISPGCISCGTCAVVCPKVFNINGGISSVKEDINLEEFQWRDLINAYCKEHSIEIKEDTIFYAPRNKERDPKLHLNYFIFDYEELTFDDIGLCLYESDNSIF